MDFGSYRDSDELFEKKKSVDWLSWCCLSPFTKYVLPIFLTCVVLVLGVYFGLLAWLSSDLDDFGSHSTCHLQPIYYVPCLSKTSELDEGKCLEVGCCWRRDTGMCYHPFPSPYGYIVDGQSGDDKVIRSTRERSPSGGEIRQRLVFHVEEVSDRHVRIALKTNADKFQSKARKSRAASGRLVDFGGFFDFLPGDGTATVEKLALDGKSSIEVLMHEPNFSVSLRRSPDESSPAKGTLLLSTARGPLIVTDHYWEWTLYMTSGSGTIYGLDSLELNGTTNWIYNNENATVKPAFVAIDNRGNAMACLVDFAGPLEVQVLNESNLVILRGFSVPDEIAIEVFSGPSGTEASQQIALATRSASSRLLQSSLYGLHLCPEVGRNKKLTPAQEGLDSLKSSIDSMKKLQAPWDSHCLYRKLGGLGLQQAKLSEAEKKIIDEAKSILGTAGKSLVSHLTPMLLNKPGDELQSALSKESCLLLNGSSVYAGSYESHPVVYPNWASSRARELAGKSLDAYLSELSPDFIVLRDDWPKDETERPRIEETQLDYLPEGLRSLMSRRTLPYDLVENDGKHYTHHNSYARSFVDFIASKSPFMEIRGESCNVEKVKASWDSLRRVLQAGIAASMMGYVPTAMYVCGAEDPYDRIDEELCDRWYGAAVSWPWILSLPEKSPGSSRLTSTTSRRIAELLRLRSSLSTYHHTVLASYQRTGFPILSTSRLHYPDEIQLRNVTLGQFFWGDSLLVGLVTQPKRKQVHMWLPGRYQWRHLRGGSAIDPTWNGSSISVPVFDGQIVTLLRPGRIISLHEIDPADPPSNSGEAMRKNLQLSANLLCTDENTCSAKGRVYYGDSSDGEFLLARLDGTSRLTLENVSKVKAVACGGSSSQATIIENVEVLGQGSASLKLDFCEYELAEGVDEIVGTLDFKKVEEVIT
ncbi:uncharacterized protein LOC100121715 [Nasonia vitripennis]|uniref:P-type domain-containing protein n=1 Tax=Nasonia vitripennis TaxID=7425 RepID=A0A7M7Q1J6_NASVI|nr:uncharacterized protein LOC100121715 [Nasonia vitripennis]